MQWRAKALWIGIACAGLASAAGAQGRTEINQTCATLTGCVAGDAPGFPVTIGAPGSYVLTGNLTVAAPSVSAIQFSTSNASLDLGGFTIAGPGRTIGTANGISADFATGSNAENLRVAHGQVTGFGGFGVQLWIGGHVEYVSASGNGIGVFLGGGGMLTSSRITGSSSGGAVLAADAVYAQNVFTNNKLSGGGVSVSGGRAVGGNYCDDGLCSTRGARLFYLTRANFLPNVAASACAPGFHFASVPELTTEGNLEYAEALGRQHVEAGVSAGPEWWGGWVRTGILGGSLSCNGWTSTAPADRGAILAAPPHSTTNPLEWQGGQQGCGTPVPVWCIAD